MNTNKKTVETNRQTRAVVTTPRLARRILPAPNISGSVGDKAASKPTSGVNTRRQETRESEEFTVVEARIDVGLGNALFIRGQGDGLSWEKGQPLSCVTTSTWIWVTDQARDKVVFKLLLNDEIWARGEDSVVEAGRKIEIVPSF